MQKIIFALFPCLILTLSEQAFSNPSLDILPVELQLLILSKLSKKDACSARGACRLLRKRVDQLVDTLVFTGRTELSIDLGFKYLSQRNSVVIKEIGTEEDFLLNLERLRQFGSNPASGMTFPNIRSIVIDSYPIRNGLTDRVLEKMVSLFPKLRNFTINLAHSNYPSENLAPHLARFSLLESVDIRFQEKVTIPPALLNVVATMANLKSVSITYPHLANVQAITELALLPNLKELTVLSSNLPPNSLAKEIAKLSTVEAVYIAGANFTDADAQEFVEHTQLKKLVIVGEGQITQNANQFFVNHPNLKDPANLELRNCP